MKRALLLIVAPTLLLAVGFAQTPAASTNTDQTNIKGCLGGGSDDNYTVVEDNTGHIFKITTNSVDLKPHLGHDVTLSGHKASGAGSGAADSSFTVTELNMISDHCAAAGAAPAAIATTPAETSATPAADATTPVETVAPAASVGTPSETARIPISAGDPPAAITSTVAENTITPAATATLPAETTVTPATDAAALATVSTASETGGTPAARPRRQSEIPAAATPTPAVTTSSSSEAVNPLAAATTTHAATASTSANPVSTPAVVAPIPTATSKGWSLWLWIALAVLVIVIGILFPFFSRWRKQKSLERTGAPNLSFTREASSEQSKSDKQGPRKAA